MSDISSEADSVAVAEVIRGLFQAFGDGRTDLIEAALAEDCTIWDVFTPQLIRGPRERARFHAADQEQMHARGQLTWKLGDPLIDVWDDTAVARYLLDFEYKPPGALAGTVRITDLLRRIDGRWLIFHHHEGLLPAGPP